MKKGQLTLYLIIGLIGILVLSFFFMQYSARTSLETTSEYTETNTFTVQAQDYQHQFDECADFAIDQANQEIGVSLLNEAAYESFVTQTVDTCMDDCISEINSLGLLKERGHTYTQAVLTESTVQVRIACPVVVERGSLEYEFRDFERAFPLVNYQQLDPNGETVIHSQGNIGQLVVPQGTQATDQDSRPITELALNLVERNFDGLQNSILVGNLVFEGLPDRAVFSPEIELRIDIRGRDIPDFVNEDELSIAWWNGHYWVPLDTYAVEPGILGAKVGHFTKFAVVIGCAADGSESVEIVTPRLYVQTYSYDEAGSLVFPGYNASSTPENFCEYIEVGEDTEGYYWEHDTDDTITPTKEEYYKILEGLGDRIAVSVPSFPEERTSFGELGLCNQYVQPVDVLLPEVEEETADVRPYCCCHKDGSEIRCMDEAVGKLECWDTLYEQAVMVEDWLNVNDEDASADRTKYPVELVYDEDGSVNETKSTYCADIFEGAPESLEREIFGYIEQDCVHGITVDGDGDSSIFDVFFKADGSSCLDEDNPYDIEYISDSGAECEGPQLLFDEEEMKFSIVYVRARNEGTCADCRAKIIFYGTGLKYNGEIYTPCDPATDSFDIVYDSGSPHCSVCEEQNVDGHTFNAFSQDTETPCTIEYGCGQCLDYAGEFGQTCAPSLEGDIFCHKELRCSGGQLVGLGAQHEQSCVNCQSGMYSTDDCVLLSIGGGR